MAMKNYVVILLVAVSLAIVMACDMTEKTSEQHKLTAPDNLQYSVTSNQLTLTWQDNSDDEDGFLIERKSDFDNEWVTIWRTAANVTSYEMNVYQVYPRPSFRVKAWNALSESDYSNIVFVPTYKSAHLMIYICPNFYDGCSSSYIVIDQNCRTIQDATPGEWYDTGFLLTTNHDYALQFCSGCISNCGAATAFSTPQTFLTSTFYSRIYAFCKSACEPPSSSMK